MAVCQFCRRYLTDADDQRRLTICSRMALARGAWGGISRASYI